MNWFIKSAETYTTLIADYIRKQFDTRFTMWHGTGSSLFVKFENDLYEVRIEEAKYAQQSPMAGTPGGLNLLQRINDMRIFDRPRQVQGRPSFIVSYSPQLPEFDRMPANRTEYMITVVPAKSSKYYSYFVDSKVSDSVGAKKNDNVVKPSSPDA